MDYIARDAKALGVDVNFDFRRYMELARILPVDDEFWTFQTPEGIKKIHRLFIGVRDKEAMNMFAMFRTRQVDSGISSCGFVRLAAPPDLSYHPFPCSPL